MERIILDNGGGIVLQLCGYAHSYDCAGQAAEDLAAWWRDGDTSSWDGHDADLAAIEPSPAEIANDGVRIVDAASPDAAVRGLAALDYWANAQNLALAIRSRMQVGPPGEGQAFPSR